MSSRPITSTSVVPGLPGVDSVLTEARKVIEAEGQAVLGIARRIDGRFALVVDRIIACRGRVVITGMGKSGLVGQKISATLASTGTPSLFMHAAEALHGDLGRVTRDDVVLALSHSGESEEVVRLLRPVRALGAYFVAVTSDAQSSLGRHADMVIELGDVQEACPIGLVPTASTTAMMVVGDALAMCLFSRRGFDREDYARYHPAGTLGRRLMKVREVMRAGQSNPVVSVAARLRQAITVMTRTPGRPGAVSVVDADGRLVGFFTDGDLRRLLEADGFCVDAPIAGLMHREPKWIRPEQLVDEAVRLLRDHQIDQLPVVDDERIAVGLIDVQDLLSTRVL